MNKTFTKDEELHLLTLLRVCYEGAMKAYFTDSDYFSTMLKEDCDKLLEMMLEIRYKEVLQ